MSSSEDALELAEWADSGSEKVRALGSAVRALVAERDATRQQLADAPHEGWCMTQAGGVYARLQGLPAECDCWKAGL